MTWCDHCGEAASDGDHATCRAARELEPPRFCPRCRRRMVVQVLPGGWTSRCVEHGVTVAESSGPVEVLEPHLTQVGAMTVARSLPRRARRTVGAWCFLDRFGPEPVGEKGGLDIGPHPHTGLHTVTYLFDGQVLHRDSLGSEQVIRPGQVNLMTAGNGVSHAEEPTGHYRGTLSGVQLWVAQPEGTRHGAAAFAHHEDLPVVELAGGTATVLVGSLGGATSAARADTPLVGADLVVRGEVGVGLDPAFEHLLLAVEGPLHVWDSTLAVGQAAYLPPGRTSLELHGPGRALLLGGEPWGEELMMWWNFVARSREEVLAAVAAWQERAERFGTVATALPRIPAPVPPWRDGYPVSPT